MFQLCRRVLEVLDDAKRCPLTGIWTVFMNPHPVEGFCFPNSVDELGVLMLHVMEVPILQDSTCNCDSLVYYKYRDRVHSQNPGLDVRWPVEMLPKILMNPIPRKQMQISDHQSARSSDGDWLSAAAVVTGFLLLCWMFQTFLMPVRPMPKTPFPPAGGERGGTVSVGTLFSWQSGSSTVRVSDLWPLAHGKS